MLYHTLSNGVKIPKFGLGTYKLTEQKAIDITKAAIALGYRHIDTATYYKNEIEIGKAIKESEIDRSELFITSKVWDDDQGYDNTIASFHESLDRLQLEYLDLYLIHWPTEKSIETWKALEDLYEQGLVKAIGVSNFHIKHLEPLLKDVKIKPMINQIERHPHLNQTELQNYCKKENIALEAWSPIARGAVLKDPIILNLAEKYNKTPGQVVLRWQIDTGFIVFPKTEDSGRLKENIDIFDFELTEKEISLINEMNTDKRYGSNPETRDII